MINADLDQFLDTGWFNEATLYYNGYTYWCEGCWDKTKEKPMHFLYINIDRLFTIITETPGHHA